MRWPACWCWKSAQDGKDIIDGWIPRQPWANGDAAGIGHSYSGITGFMVAATQSAHLKAASVSGLVDDLYRGLIYPGGVSDYGFPLLWAGAIRPVYDVAAGLAPGIIRPNGDDVANRQARCAEAATTKSRTVTDDPLVQGLSPTDTEWYRARSLLTYADRITVPLHITGAYQDEQTGPRGPTHLFQAAGNAPYRRLLELNGNHDAQTGRGARTPTPRRSRPVRRSSTWSRSSRSATCSVPVTAWSCSCTRPRPSTATTPTRPSKRPPASTPSSSAPVDPISCSPWSPHPSSAPRSRVASSMP